MVSLDQKAETPLNGQLHVESHPAKKLAGFRRVEWDSNGFGFVVITLCLLLFLLADRRFEVLEVGSENTGWL